MISLNTERGLVTVASWEDVLSLPGFTDAVDHRTQKLVSVIGRYILSDPVHCGLKSCRTPHKKGFVAAIEGGAVTNIGKDCGKTHFGVGFEEMSRNFERDDRNRERRERLQEFQSQVPGIRKRISALRGEQGGDLIHKASRYFRSNCNVEIRDALSALVARRDGQLTKRRRETQQEADAREAMNDQRPGREDDKDHVAKRLTIEEPAGFVRGLGVFYPEMNLRALLIEEILAPLQAIEEISVPNLGDRELLNYLKVSASIEDKIKKAEQAIEEGKQFLLRVNLAKFSPVLANPSDSKPFNRLLAEVEKMMGGNQ